MNVDKSQQSYRYPSFSIRRCCDMSIKKKYRKFCSVLFLGLQSSSWALNFGFRKKHKIHNTQSIIGDSSRDFLSSTVFFDSIDRDGDGTLRHKELFNYILQSIGGSDFDIKAEVEYEISTMMEKFDINLDQGLDNKDFNSFWKVLDNLLTVEEVADWIMYACQLPEEIGEIFRKHHVTGYDFPELVENEGQSLQSELNISNTRWRNTIVRMVRARILGIGVNPSAPNKFTYHVQDCDAVKIEWTKCEAKRGFPVHGYRVQRRRVIGAGFNENYITNKNINNENCDWQTIYSGVDTDVVNTGLEYEQYISFRVQSWSSIGKSEWMYIDINLNKKRRKLKCKPINYEDNPMKNYSAKKNSPLLTFNVVINFIYVIGKIFICIFGLLATTLKVLSTPSTQQYDEFVNATKLKVYRKLKQEDTITNKINRTNSISSYTTNYNWKWNSKNKEEVSLFSLIDHLTLSFVKWVVNFLWRDQVNATPKIDDSITYDDSHCKKSDISFKRKNPNSSIVKPTMICQTSNNMNDAQKDNIRSVDHSSGGSCNRCNECGKKFKRLKRIKHHCVRCTKDFCHKHGRTPHFNFLACRIPGNCVCDTCLKGE